MTKDLVTTNTWWSLTESEKICLQTEFEVTIQNIHMEFKDPCVDPLDTCKISVKILLLYKIKSLQTRNFRSFCTMYNIHLSTGKYTYN